MSYAPTELPGDSLHYDLLYRAAMSIKDVPGFTFEIGLRRGGGTETIIQGCIDSGRTLTPHMAVDPYGNVDYQVDQQVMHMDYTNVMRLEALPLIYKWLADRGVTFIYWPLADRDLFLSFPHGLPYYSEQGHLMTSFALVHFDGPHSTQAVLEEVAYFRQFAPLGAAWVFDDVSLYPHLVDCDPAIQAAGFEQVEIHGDRRIWYRKVR